MKQPNRVLIFSTAQVLGGGEVYVERIVGGLYKKFRISVLAHRQVLRRINAPVKKFALGGFPQTIERYVPGGYRLKQIYYYLRHGSGSLFKRSYTDLVHFQIYDERLLSLLTPRLMRKGILRLITMHNEFTPQQATANRYRPHVVLCQFSAIICTCNVTKLNLVSLGVPAEKCHVIHNGVDIQRFTPNGMPGKFITWVGRVDEWDKNPMLFVRIAEPAHQRNLPYQFRMVGEGPLLPTIREYLGTRGMHNLQLYGWAQDTREIYREARILCITSTSEGLPLVASEAMASGVPVVASNVGGVPELITDDSVGLLVRSSNEADFLKAITLLCEDSGRYMAISRSARAWIEQAFSLDDMLDQVAKLYADLLEVASVPHTEESAHSRNEG